MNDSAFGELIAAGAQEGEDFGATAFPGTDDSFLAVVDVFVAATKAKNARNALAFLGDISKPATQIGFNKSKGSIPVVRDVDVASLRIYQRAASMAFWTSPVLLSIAHGEAMSPEFQEASTTRCRRTSGRGIRTPSQTTWRMRSPGTRFPNAEPPYQDEDVAGVAVVLTARQTYM
jgi:hypothetical protein